MGLFCCICGSVSVWELWWVAAEGEGCDDDGGFRIVVPELNPVEQPNPGVDTGSVACRAH